MRPPASRLGKVSIASGGLLAALLLVHMGLAGYAVARAWSGLAPAGDGFRPLVIVAAVTAAVLGCALLRWPWHGSRIFVAAAVAAAVLVLRPGPVLVVALMLGNAFVVGERVLRGPWRQPRPTEPPELPIIVSMLAGLSVWIGVIAMTAALRLHTQPVYAVALMLPLAIGWRRALSLVSRLRDALAPRSMTRGEHLWLAVLIVLAVLHLIVAAKPDVGYDAATVHLRLPMLMEQHQRWIQDVSRYVWAVMPLGADYSYATAYLLSGETAVRLLNLCYGATACGLAYLLARRYADRVLALACVAMIASAPLAFLETGTLYIENLWLAYLLGVLLTAFRVFESSAPEDALACAFMAAGAMQTKAIAVVWLAPLLLVLGVACLRKQRLPRLTRGDVATLTLAIVLAAWPYLNAWVRTGNPLFPFMNAVFRSPLFYTDTSFANELYMAPFGALSLYDVLIRSGRYIEGVDGAAGLHLFLLVALAVWGCTRWRMRTAAQWWCLALALFFFAVVFSQQSYLRYLLPSLVLIAIVGTWAFADLAASPRWRTGILMIAAVACVMNLRFMASASSQNASLCLACSYDADSRRDYLGTYAPERLVGRYLNAALPAARVGFFVVNGPGASDFIGYSRAANWHDVDTYGRILQASSVDDIAALARRHALTHLVVPAADPRCGPDLNEQRLINDFRDRHTTELWRLGCLSVAAIVEVAAAGAPGVRALTR